MSEKIRFAVAGSGWRALFYVRAARRLPDWFELTGVLCHTREKAQAFAREHGVKAVSSLEALLEDAPDFVVTCVRKADMAEIFATCQVVSNHLANLPATVGIIKREHLLSMLPYSTFINTGRGPQLNEQDLFDMLVQDSTRTALLDVMTEEGKSVANPLNQLENCLITPHIAGSSGREVRRMADYMLDTFERVRAGQPSDYEVTMKMLESMA